MTEDEDMLDETVIFLAMTKDEDMLDEIVIFLAMTKDENMLDVDVDCDGVTRGQRIWQRVRINRQRM